MVDVELPVAACSQTDFWQSASSAVASRRVRLLVIRDKPRGPRLFALTCAIDVRERLGAPVNDNES